MKSNKWCVLCKSSFPSSIAREYTLSRPSTDLAQQTPTHTHTSCTRERTAVTHSQLGKSDIDEGVVWHVDSLVDHIEWNIHPVTTCAVCLELFRRQIYHKVSNWIAVSRSHSRGGSQSGVFTLPNSGYVQVNWLYLWCAENDVTGHVWSVVPCEASWCAQHPTPSTHIHKLV